jgi:hypothetical protein
MAFNYCMCRSFSEIDVRARGSACPIYPGQPFGQAISWPSCGSLHHISHPDKVVNRYPNGKHPANAVNSAMTGLAQHSDCLHPSKDFFDAFPLPSDRISGILSTSMSAPDCKSYFTPDSRPWVWFFGTPGP